MQWLILLALGAFALKKKPTALDKARVKKIARVDSADAVALAQATKALGKTAAEKRGDE